MDKVKCDKCKKKIGIIIFDCKCNGKFCSLHRHSDTHDCPYDFKLDGMNKLIKDNPKIISNKITII
jgi:predicted nucleic acid binding AN1-type Zn finger protein